MTDVPPDTSAYTDLITSEHSLRPNFMASLQAIIAPIAEIIEEQCRYVGLFDLDTAVGAQLDILGLWIGASRYLELPLVGVYFSWAENNLGWGQAPWKGPFDPVEGLTKLNDDDYRAYLQATVMANHWDGSISGLYDILNALVGAHWVGLLDDTAVQLLDDAGAPIGQDAPIYWGIQDNGDMSFDLVAGPAVPAVPLALVMGGYLHIKPAGVRMNVIQSSAPPGQPPLIFGWNAETSQVAGWGEGYWPTVLATL